VQSKLLVSALLHQLVHRGVALESTFILCNKKLPSVLVRFLEHPPSMLAKAALRNVLSVLPWEAVQRIASFLSSETSLASVSASNRVSKLTAVRMGDYMNPEYTCNRARFATYYAADARPQTDFRGHCLQLSISVLR
jgi:hypothetical protein